MTTAAAMVALAAGAFAQTTTGAPAKSAVAAKRHAGKRTTSIVAKGTIAGFDHSTNTLTIKTAKGQEQFTLPTTARIQEASRHLTVNDLDGLNGRMVNVRYRESGGQRTVQSVRVAAPAKKAQS
jgi:hypothetical protein